MFSFFYHCTIGSNTNSITNAESSLEIWSEFLGRVKAVVHVEDERKESVEYLMSFKTDEYSVIRKDQSVANALHPDTSVEVINDN